MEIKEMTMDQVEARLAEINPEAEGADLEALSAEMDALEARKKEIIKAAEERRKELEFVAQEQISNPVVKETKMEERKFTIDSVEYRDAFIKDLMGKALDAEERAAITATDAIPTITENKIINVLKENKLLGKVDFMQIPGYVRIPVYTTNAEASWASTSTDSEDVIGHIDLTPYQLIKTIEVPATVDKMSISAFESYIVEALSNKIESALQAAIINGDGSSKATGIAVTVATATGTFTKAAATKADLLKIMGSLPAGYQKNACWVMPAKVFYGEVMNISTHDSFVNVNDGFDFRLFGKPVVLDDECIISSTDTILYGDPKHYHLNLGEGIKVDKDLSVGFRSNSAVYRAVCLADGKLDQAKAFVKYTRATA